MNTKTRLGLAVVLIAAMGLLIWLPRAREQSLRLPDGTLITFKGAEFGTNHTYPPNARFLKAVRRYLPVQLRRKFFPGGGGYAIGQDSVFFWYRQEVPTNAPLRRLQRVLVDDSGVESAVLFAGCRSRFPDGSNLEGCGWTLWPRRSTRLGLRFYQEDGTNPLVRIGEFWVKNPRRIDSVQWEPQALPTSAAAGDLQVTLVGWQHGRLPASLGETQPEGDWLYLRFRVAQKGKPSNAWEVRQGLLEDAGGNKMEFGGPSYTAGEEEIVPMMMRLREGAQVRILPLSLWSGEKAWKIGLTLSPRSNAPFSPEELHVVGDLTVPDPGAFIALNTTNAVPGGALLLDGLYGKGLDPSGPEGRFPDSVVLALTPPRPVVVVKAVDESGREIRFAPPVPFSRQVSAGSSGTNSWAGIRLLQGIALNVPPESKSLAITFGFATNRVVTFLASAPEFPSGLIKEEVALGCLAFRPVRRIT